MGFKRGQRLGVVDFVHPADDAIDRTETDIQEYKGTWDPKLLVYKDGMQPTRFKINFSLNWNKHRAIKNATLGMDDDGKAAFMLGNHSSQLVKSVLVGIDNPPDMEEESKIIFKLNKKSGLVDDSVLLELQEYDVLDSIYSFYNLVKDDHELLKKS